MPKSIRNCLGRGRLGDATELALEKVGINQERVERWLGDCGCEERKQRLNALGVWAVRFLRKPDGMKQHLEDIIRE